MKSYCLYIAFLLLCCCSVTIAQQLYNDQVTLQNVVCEQKGDQIRFSMNIDAGKADIPLRKALVLTPVIKSGDKESELPPVVISGKNRYKADNRIKHFHGDTVYKTPYVTVKSDSNEATGISCDYTTPFEPWMKDASVEIKEAIYSCAGCKDSESQHPLTSILFENTEPQKPEIKPVFSYINPMAENVKNRNMVGKAYLDFPVGKAVILTDFRNNFKELSKIQEAINQLRDDPNAEINSITLKGFASPEGVYATNERLSEQRSQALKTYLQKEFQYNNDMFHVSSVAEDWVGLRVLVDTSGIASKQAILNIIDGTSNYDAKERELKALNGGKTYSELLKDQFPQLRRVEYKLDFTIRAFSVEEGKEIVKTHPGQMSLNEMFLVANTYPKGSNDFNYVFDVAVRMYPADTIANINAAAIELGKGVAASAHRYLDPYQQVPDSWNNQGIMYMIEGDYVKAKDFLTKAQVHGSSEAVENLGILELLQDYQAKKDAYDVMMKK